MNYEGQQRTTVYFTGALIVYESPDKSCRHYFTPWAGQRSRYSDWLRGERSGDRIPVWTRFSAPVQTGPGAHPASCAMGTGSFQRVKSGRGVTLAPHPLLVPWSRKGTAIPLLPIWAVRPVQSLSACTVELYLYSPYEQYGLYRASVPVQGCTLPFTGCGTYQVENFVPHN
jgi:DNA-binding transcriptional LysR family regulator